MCSSRCFLVLLALHSSVALVSALRSNSTSSWQTLSRNAPLVIARGGFSGLFPDSSLAAYTLAVAVSVPDVVLWCDVQLTKDGAGICLPDLKLENSTDISSIYAKDKNQYLVNGVNTTGWFSIDFTLNDLASVSLDQGIYSRTNKFDGNSMQILTVKDVVTRFNVSGLWLNIQHDAFFSKHNLSMRSYVLSVSKTVVPNYISSPEVNFLRSIATRFNSTKTKLVFRFLNADDLEVTTNQTYGSLLRNLSFIKTFASGILVPKYYIWPVDASGYLLPHTSLVPDAHKHRLEVFASEFYNDIPLSYNYSYDTVTEFLSYIDNGEFSVDGVLTDFPISPSHTIDCFAHLGDADKKQEKPLVISKFGASGDYPGCTDLAYTKAISDGVDILDCPVQIAKDGTPFCLSSINLIDSTTIAQTTYSNLWKTIPEIKSGGGIYAFDLTWPQISGLTPAILNPFSIFSLFRNPLFKNSGKFLTLSDFLALAKNTSSLLGIVLRIENAAYLAEHQDLSVVDAVLDALSKAGYDSQTSQIVMIRSTSSAILKKIGGGNKKYHYVYEVGESTTAVFKKIGGVNKRYQYVSEIGETISDALDSAIVDIKSFSDAVIVGKFSVFSQNDLFTTGSTNVVEKLHSYNLSVYVKTFSNEFVSQPWDYFSDATVEINSYFMGADIDGVITDFPKTAVRYKRNRCLNLGNKRPIYMSPVEPGSLYKLITTAYLPPAKAPSPVLTVSDVNDPWLPSVEPKPPAPSSPRGLGTTPPTPSGQPRLTSFCMVYGLGLLLATLVPL